MPALEPLRRAALMDRSGTSSNAPLRVLTFDVGEHLFGVPADQVARILPAGASPGAEVSVVDALGLLGNRGNQDHGNGCLIVLASRAPSGEQVAITGSYAGEIRSIDPRTLLPVPSYLFRDENPFQGICVPEKKEDGDAGKDPRALFLLAGPERLLARAEAG